jgi:hypothetical protein
MSKDIDFVRLQLEPLAVTVQANARAWVKELGRLLNDSAKQNLMSLKMEMEVFSLMISEKISLVNNTRQKMINLFRVDENRIEQCFSNPEICLV